jgi:hypothetical protein
MTCSEMHKQRSDAKANSTPNNLSEMKCGCCGSKKTDIINKEGTLVFGWMRDPLRMDNTICGNCHRKRLYRLGRFVRIRKLGTTINS